MLRAAMDDARAELQTTEDEVRQQAANPATTRSSTPLRGFGDIADELDAHAVAVQETADTIATLLESLPPSSA